MIRNRYIWVALLAIGVLTLFGGCAKELDVRPKGDVLMPDQVAANAGRNEETLQSQILGMYDVMGAYAKVFGNSNYQIDYGYPSIAVMLESAGDNLNCPVTGYNWYLRHQDYSVRGKTGDMSDYIWTFMYKNIKNANDLIAVYSSNLEEFGPTVAQAKAFRAWSYFFLAQCFQFTYKGNEAKPCVPIVTEETPADKLLNNPRATVKEVYELILKDLDDACKGLKGVPPASKVQISEAVAYGIRSRVNLVMNRWSEAAADAQKAIDIAKSYGIAPFTIAECSIPNFDKLATSGNAMWGIVQTEKSGPTKQGICNYTSMFTSLCYGSGGYTTYGGVFKRITPYLFSTIPSTDVRKGWWVTLREFHPDPDPKKFYYVVGSPLLDKGYPEADRLKITDSRVDPPKKGMNHLLPRSVVKFAPTDKNLFSNLNSNDFILMRVEEMYYILAEAKEMAGKGGKAVLENFVKTYRDPAYTMTGNIQDEIYHQRRIEFWGEGIVWFDMMRLKKGLNRVFPGQPKPYNGFPPSNRFNLKPDDANLLLQIPQNEKQNNPAIVYNPDATPPKDFDAK